VDADGQPGRAARKRRVHQRDVAVEHTGGIVALRRERRTESERHVVELDVASAECRQVGELGW
jgi:hypothetical protein